MNPVTSLRYVISLLFSIILHNTANSVQLYPKVPADMISYQSEMKSIASADVYSKSEWNYILTDGNVTTNKYKTKVIKFDKLGRIMEVMNLNPKGENLSVIIFRYDNNNLPLQETEFLPTGELIGRTKYTYDSKGRLKDITWLNGFEFIVNRKAFDINESLNLVTEWQYYAPDSVTSKTEFYYSNLINGILLKQNNYNGEKQLSSSIIYHRDSLQVILKEEIRDASKKLTGFHEYQYNKKGQLMQILVVYPDKRKIPKFTYNYDVDGLVSGIIEYDEKGSMIAYKRFTYE